MERDEDLPHRTKITSAPSLSASLTSALASEKGRGTSQSRLEAAENKQLDFEPLSKAKTPRAAAGDTFGFRVDREDDSPSHFRAPVRTPSQAKKSTVRSAANDTFGFSRNAGSAI